jgi:plastocyanin domain-containing protein
MTILYVIFAAGVGLVVAACVSDLRRRRPCDDRRIRVRGGYDPAEVHIGAGRPARLIFRREETAACSEQVVFPDFGISVTLLPFEDTVVDLPASEPGVHEFTCQTQTLQGRIIVDRGAATR